MNSINPRKCARTAYPSDVAARLQIRKILNGRARRDAHRLYQEKKCYCGQWHLVVVNNCVVRNKEGQGAHLEYRHPVELNGMA